MIDEEIRKKKDEYIFINRIIKNTGVEGFGNRYCIWVQGCSIRCPQCSNQDMWEKESGKKYKVDDIIKDILNQGSNIEGITFLGGEPFEQPKSLAIISEKVRKEGYSVITFSGYEYDYLKENLEKDIQKLLENTDLLIDGPFKIEKLDYSKPWTGSSNQQYIFLSNRYRREQLERIKNRFEIHIDNNGRVSINGMGNYEKIIEFLKEGNRLWEK